MDNLLLSGDLETGMFTSGIPVVAKAEEQHDNSFMESCFLCEKRIGSDRDVFIYKGDTAFCSDECRQVQIYIDDAKEMKQKKKSNKRMLSSSSSSSSSSPSPAAVNKGQKVHVRAATMLVVA